jgi:hypothetical protein
MSNNHFNSGSWFPIVWWLAGPSRSQRVLGRLWATTTAATTTANESPCLASNWGRNGWPGPGEKETWAAQENSSWRNNSSYPGEAVECFGCDVQLVYCHERRRLCQRPAAKEEARAPEKDPNGRGPPRSADDGCQRRSEQFIWRRRR